MVKVCVKAERVESSNGILGPSQGCFTYIKAVFSEMVEEIRVPGKTTNLWQVNLQTV